MRHFSKKNWFWLIPLAICGVALLVLVTMLLWNWLMPLLFKLPVISYWQAAGLMLLSRLILGFGGHRGGHHLHHRNNLRERWEKMTPEEREKFREHMKMHHRPFWFDMRDADSANPGNEPSR